MLLKRFLALAQIIHLVTVQDYEFLGCSLPNSNPCLYKNVEWCDAVYSSEVTAEAVDQCILQCEDHPGYSIVNGLDSACYCLWNDDTLCIGSNAAVAALTSTRTANPVMPLVSGGANLKLIGTGLKVSEVAPVVCTNPEECLKLPHPCDVGPCLSDECHFEGHCYHVESRGAENFNMVCSRGRPADIASKREYDHFIALTRNAWTSFGVGVHRVMTAGVVPAGAEDFFWDQSDTPGDTIYEFSPGFDIGGSEDFNRAHYVKTVFLIDAMEFMNVLEPFDLDETVFEWILCKDTASCEIECNESDQYGNAWECCGATTCSNPCPNGAMGTAYWRCGINKKFESQWPNYDGCSRAWVDDLENQIAEGKLDSLDLLMAMDQYVDESMFGSELETALNFTLVSLDLLLAMQAESGASPAAKLNQLEFQAELSVRTVEKVFSLENPWQQLSDRGRIETGDKALEVLDAFGLAMANQSATIGDKDYAGSVSRGDLIVQAQFLKNSSVIKFPIDREDAKSSIEIKVAPNKKFAKNGLLGIESAGSFLPAEFAEAIYAPLIVNPEIESVLNSEMVSATVRNAGMDIDWESGLKVTIRFRHRYEAKGPAYHDLGRALRPGEEATAVRGTAQCVFWNASKGSFGEWDTSGCRLVESGQWVTVCECDHLSSFCAIMDKHGYFGDSPALEVLGIVCSSLSIVALAITIIVLNLIRSKDHKQTLITKHLSFCLLVSHLLSLLFLDGHYFQDVPALCQAVGVVLHYFTLAVFSWMAVEGHHLYLKMVRVYDSGRSFTLIYWIVGYGAPLLIVVITCIVTGSQGFSGYGGDNLCWLTTPDYIWAFAGPAALVVVGNCILLGVMMTISVTRGKEQKQRYLAKFKVWIFGFGTLSALLGVTWIFGYLFMLEKYIFAYPFVILNGCQGVLIFLNRVALNKQVTDEVRRTWKKRQLNNKFKTNKVPDVDSKIRKQVPVTPQTSQMDVSATSNLSGSRPGLVARDKPRNMSEWPHRTNGPYFVSARVAGHRV